MWNLMHGVEGGGVKDWFTMGGRQTSRFCRITFPVYRAQSYVLVGTRECPEVCAFFWVSPSRLAWGPVLSRLMLTPGGHQNRWPGGSECGLQHWLQKVLSRALCLLSDGVNHKGGHGCPGSPSVLTWKADCLKHLPTRARAALWRVGSSDLAGRCSPVTRPAFLAPTLFCTKNE